MPVNKYFRGSGDQVMSDMKDRYGDKKGKNVFYATAEKRDMKPEERKPAPRPRRKTFGQRVGDQG